MKSTLFALSFLVFGLVLQFNIVNAQPTVTANQFKVTKEFMAFSATLENDSKQALTFDLWAEMTTKDGLVVASIVQPSITLPAGGKVLRKMRHQIPQELPGGGLFEHVYVGSYPGKATTRSSFEWIWPKE